MEEQEPERDTWLLIKVGLMLGLGLVWALSALALLLTMHG